MRTLFEPDIQERFEQFDAEHPEVWRWFVHFANELLAKGVRHSSADMILHRVRFETAANRERDGGFKINDHFTSRYARKLIDADPRFAQFFELRKIKA